MGIKERRKSAAATAELLGEIKELNLCDEPADIKIPKTIKELLTEYAFNPANKLVADNNGQEEFQADYWKKPDSTGKMVLWTAKAAAKYNITEGDPFLKANLLNNIADYTAVSSEISNVIWNNPKEILNEKLDRPTQWSSTERCDAENLYARQTECDQMFKMMSDGCIGIGKEGNFLGYAATSIALTAWCAPKRAKRDKNAMRILETMTPPINFSNDKLFKRTAKKRLLDKSGIQQYQEISDKLNYDYNVGICSSAYVAWTGWYLINCSDQSAMPLKRALMIGAIEMIGITNWATIEEMFTLPTIRPIALDMVRVMRQMEWRSDPSCVAGVWSGIYQNMKRRDNTSGKWPSPGFYDSWTYSAVQPVENVDLSANTVLVESDVDPDLLFRINKVWRMYNDLLDINTDAVTGEVNNNLCGLLLTHLEKETSRTELAEVCIAYHDELMDLLEGIIADSDARCGYSASSMSRACALWYMWISRYNTWHKYLLGLKSRVLEGKQKPTIRWEMVDPVHMAKVFEDAGCSCAQTKYVEFVKSCIPNNREENTGFTNLYTAMVSAILGMTACHSEACACGEKLAEYMDAEPGGEYCGHVLGTLYLPEKEKGRYADILMELVDSREYNIYRFVGAGCGYFFQEMCEKISGSLFHHCSLD